MPPDRADGRATVRVLASLAGLARRITAAQSALFIEGGAHGAHLIGVCDPAIRVSDRARGGTQNASDNHFDRTRGLGSAAALGGSHGSERHSARFWAQLATRPRSRARQPHQGVSRRRGRNRCTTEQYRDGAHYHLVHGRRTGGDATGAGGHAGRQRRHDFDRPGSVLRCGEHGAGFRAHGRHHVPQGRGEPDPRPRPGRDRLRSHAAGAARNADRHHAIREHAKSPPRTSRFGQRTADRLADRRCADLGRPFQRGHRVAGGVFGCARHHSPDLRAGHGAGGQPGDGHQSAH